MAEHEARLLTANEIIELPRYSIVWIEFYDAEEGEATALLAAMKCSNGALIDEEASIYSDFEEDMKTNQTGYWRFWDAKPTLKQREDTPWE